MYISSADFMTRNTTRRVEVAAPVNDPNLRAHLEQMFADQLRDTAKGRVQQPDGGYVRVEGEPFNSQEYFCDQAYGGAWALPRLKAPEKSRSAARPIPKPMPVTAKKPAPSAAPPKKPAPSAAPPKKPAPNAAPPAQKRPAVKVQARRTGLLGRIFGRG